MDRSGFLDIVNIVGQYVQLTPEGDSHYLGKCPFCGAEESSLILSKDTQYWSCMSCGLHGDRYDFVAKSEKISRAEAILMVGHHTNSGEPFPHARYKPAPAKPAEAPKPARPAGAPAAAPAAAPAPKPEPAPPQAAPASAAQPVAVPFIQFKNIIPSYQGAALLDDRSRVLASDSEFSFSADLAGIGAQLAPGLAHAAALVTKWGMGNALPATLTLASEELAILAHKFGPADRSRLLLVRLANPSDAAVARRLVASASAKLT